MVWHDATWWYVTRKPWFTGKENWRLTEVRQAVSWNRRIVWYLYYKDLADNEQIVEEEIHNHSSAWFKGASTCLVDSRLYFWTQWEDKEQKPKVQQSDTGEQQDEGDISDIDLSAPPPDPEMEVAGQASGHVDTFAPAREISHSIESEVEGQASSHADTFAPAPEAKCTYAGQAICHLPPRLSAQCGTSNPYEDSETGLEAGIARLDIHREKRYSPY